MLKIYSFMDCDLETQRNIRTQHSVHRQIKHNRQHDFPYKGAGQTAE